jgi:hypothetical protein
MLSEAAPEVEHRRVSQRIASFGGGSTRDGGGGAARQSSSAVAGVPRGRALPRRVGVGAKPTTAFTPRTPVHWYDTAYRDAWRKRGKRYFLACKAFGVLRDTAFESAAAYAAAAAAARATCPVADDYPHAPKCLCVQASCSCAASRLHAKEFQYSRSLLNYHRRTWTVDFQNAVRARKHRWELQHDPWSLGVWEAPPLERNRCNGGVLRAAAASRPGIEAVKRGSIGSARRRQDITAR